MTGHRDIERVLDAWLAEGPLEMSDLLFDGLVDRVERLPQRRLAGITTRLSDMNLLFRFAAAAAIVAIVGVVGFAIITKPASNVAAPSSPSPAPTPTDVSEPVLGSLIVCIPNDGSCAGALLAGRHTSTLFSPQTSYVVPDGWANNSDMPIAYSLELKSDAEREIDSFRSTNLGPSIILFADPVGASVDASCNVKSAPGTTSADALATWVASRPGITATKPTSISIGSLTGRMVDVRVAASWTKDCAQLDGNEVRYATPTRYVALIRSSSTPPDGGWSFTEWGPSGPERQRFIFVDVGGGKAVAVVVDTPNPNDFDAFVARAMPIVRSLTFGH